jgi:hypothetical protein
MWFGPAIGDQGLEGAIQAGSEGRLPALACIWVGLDASGARKGVQEV